MADLDDVILVELERLAPRGERMSSDWDDILRRCGPVDRVALTAPRGWRVLLVVAVLVLAVAGPTVAFSSGVRSFLGLGGPRPVSKEARLVVSAPVGNGLLGHLWFSPSTTGGRCVFITVDRAATPRSPGDRYGGGSCSVRGAVDSRADRAHPFETGLLVTSRLGPGIPRTWVPPIVSGSVYKGLHATRVAVVWRGGFHELVLRDGFFFGGSPTFYMPPFQDFPFVVIAYNAAGQAVSRQRLQSPALRLMRNGWEQYAREYHAWQKAHHR